MSLPQDEHHFEPHSDASVDSCQHWFTKEESKRYFSWDNARWYCGGAESEHGKISVEGRRICVNSDNQVIQ